jgi:soluble lytic murein transglycosylase-like protein
MMKTVAKILILSASMALAQHFINLEAPKPIRVKAPTEQSIREEMKREQKQKLYNRATLVASQVYRRNGCKDAYADATAHAAIDNGLSPRLLAGLVYVESSCNPAAASNEYSIGLAQINMRIWKYSKTELCDPRRNLYIGASILASYVQRFGMTEGLRHYNGLGNPTSEYAKKVLTAAGISVSEEDYGSTNSSNSNEVEGPPSS